MNEKQIITAAGGLVINEANEILLIFRRGCWDLPKGKLDPNESVAECAVREVEEETGVSQIMLGNLIAITSHEYFDNYTNANVKKETHWYHMRVDGKPNLIPQTIEDITAIEWTKKNDLAERLSNTYPTIIEVITKAGLL
jgi:8-oxo-dGTP pyrophosphatase MutT (NUDIX family)